jgi:hypothetical protein
MSMECPLLSEHVARHISQRPSKINYLRTSSPFASCCAEVMQDKGIPNFVERICTILLSLPATDWYDMYFFYILPRQYIAPLYRYLLY